MQYIRITKDLLKDPVTLQHCAEEILSRVLVRCRWSVMNFAPGGDTYFTCVLNSGVHVFMCVSV